MKTHDLLYVMYDKMHQLMHGVHNTTALCADSKALEEAVLEDDIYPCIIFHIDISGNTQYSVFYDSLPWLIMIHHK